MQANIVANFLHAGIMYAACSHLQGGIIAMANERAPRGRAILLNIVQTRGGKAERYVSVCLDRRSAQIQTDRAQFKMKTHGILHNELAKLVARLGHGDMLVITDRGFPFPRHDQTVCIDVSVGRDLPKVVDVLKVVLEELEIEKVIIADETRTVSPHIYEEFKNILASKRNKGNAITEENMPHSAFKHLVLNGALEGKEVKGFVKSGEFTPYANIILVSGVDF